MSRTSAQRGSVRSGPQWRVTSTNPTSKLPNTHLQRIAPRSEFTSVVVSWREAAHLPGLVRQAGEAGAGADARPDGSRRGRAMDDGVQPGCLHARPVGRALPAGG